MSLKEEVQDYNPIKEKPTHPLSEEKIKTMRLELNTIPTSVTMIPYADKIFITVTQLGKIGNLVLGKNENSLQNNKKLRNITTIFGSRKFDEPLHLLASIILEDLEKKSNRALLLGSSFKNKLLKNDEIKVLVAKILENKIW